MVCIFKGDSLAINWDGLSGVYADSMVLDQASLGIKRFWCWVWGCFCSDVSLHPREKIHGLGVINLIGLILCRSHLRADERWGRGWCFHSLLTHNGARRTREAAGAARWLSTPRLPTGSFTELADH